MNKATLSTTSTLETVTNAFTDHSLIVVKKQNGEMIGPGYIAIMYGGVAFRIYSKNLSKGSHFVRLEEVAEIVIDPVL